MTPRFPLLALLLPLTAAAQSPSLHWKNFSQAQAAQPAPPAAAASSAPAAQANPNIETPDAPTRPLDLQVQALGDDNTAATDPLPPPEAPSVPQAPPAPVRPGSNAQRQGLLDASNDYLKRMDKDGDGRVSQDEFIDWMSYSFNARDANHDDVLSGDELPGGKGAPITRAQFRDNLQQRFLKQDGDHDGYLSARELAAPPK